ncbi:hypothetical protein [Photorhabdus luminescens]|uniref:phage tail fiber protein n=1 Tax=Photorhabdus luminescens TaxID=29488 RepID=UPI0020CBF050|nr:hypothetical protein [Photorhabdus luminescens]
MNWRILKNLGLSETVEQAKNAVSTNDFNSLKTVVDSKASNNDLNKKMDVGAFGLGARVSQYIDTNSLVGSGFYVTDEAKVYPTRWVSIIRVNYGSNTAQSEIAITGGNVNTDRCFLRTYSSNSNKWNSIKEFLLIGVNVTTDGNGFYKKSSPMVEIYPNGTFSTNEESEGAKVTKEGTGVYRISNISGYNADGAWGIHGGISVPKDNNGLELIFIDDRVQCNGSIIIETFHRQHSHLPTRFQNWRLKCIDENNQRVFYEDGEPCDIPDNYRLDVRVQMPEDVSMECQAAGGR